MSDPATNQALGLRYGTILVRPYNPKWPRLFEAEKQRLLAALGPLVVDIQHIGSTSIPGLAAKPIIDMGAAAPSFEVACQCIPILEDLGYTYLGEEGIPQRLFFTLGDPRTFNLHINVVGSDDWRRTILFRDYLRQHPDIARSYEQLKFHLAQQFPHDPKGYVEGKTEFVWEVLKKAGF